MSGLRYSDIETEAFIAASTALNESPAAAARAAIAVAEKTMARVAAEPTLAAALKGVACRKGCGWCCHQVVGITTAEEEMLVAAANALPASARARLKARQIEAEHRLRCLPVEEWQAARVPCPILENGRCVLHAARPLPCRAVLSADVAACKAWHDGDEGARIPLIAVQRNVHAQVQAALAQALAAAGTPPGPVSLIEALSLMAG
ncbi:MAG: YkgJ family cysteine cluster protein [Actinomycetota bacterium]